MTRTIHSGGGGGGPAMRARVFARARTRARRKGPATDRPSVSGTDVIIWLMSELQPPLGSRRPSRADTADRKHRFTIPAAGEETLESQSAATDTARPHSGGGLSNPDG